MSTSKTAKGAGPRRTFTGEIHIHHYSTALRSRSSTISDLPNHAEATSLRAQRPAQSFDAQEHNQASASEKADHHNSAPTPLNLIDSPKACTPPPKQLASRCLQRPPKWRGPCAKSTAALAAW
jgi:hypothetical protein